MENNDTTNQKQDGIEERAYLTIDPNVKVGRNAIADGQTDAPVRVITLGNIFATVEDVETKYRWNLMANRLTAIPNTKP